MKSVVKKTCLAGFAAAGALVAANALAVETVPQVRGGTIGYVVTDAHWGGFQSPEGKEECPNGINKMGPREQFKADHPDGGTLAETALKREGESWFPQNYKEKFPFNEATGKTAIGLNLVFGLPQIGRAHV